MTPTRPVTQSLVRLAALKASGLLDALPEPAFDHLTRLITTALRVPVALISLVDEDRQFFQSQCGLPEPWASRRETPLSHSFCQHVVNSGEPLLIEDARKHPLVRDNLAIRDLNVIAYAGMPVIDAEGFVLGSLCAIDIKPRSWSTEDVEMLRSLSAQFSVELQLRLATAALADDLQRQRSINDDRRVMARLNVHDLRTPLAALVMGMELINRLGPLNENQANYLALCKRNGKVLRDMVDDLLDIGSVEQQGADGLSRTECRPHDIVATAVEQVRPLAMEKSITVHATIDNTLTVVAADVDKLTRVLVNLLGNSMKFTDAGGSVVIAATASREVGQPVVQFAVKDTGIGIADTRHIFQEGFKVDRQSTTRKSTGLGLTFCKRVVEAHDGRIWVESEVGLGSTFYFTIPYAAVDVAVTP